MPESERYSWIWLLYHGLQQGSVMGTHRLVRKVITWMKPDEFQSIILNKGVMYQFPSLYGITLLFRMITLQYKNYSGEKADQYKCIVKNIKIPHTRQSQINTDCSSHPILIIIQFLGFCSKKNSSKLEMLQQRALRLVSFDQNVTYDDLLKTGNFLSQH